MKRTFIKMLPVMAAILLATSCSKDDGDNAAIDTQIDNPQQTVSNAYKTVTISGKVGKATLSKVTVSDSYLQFEGDGGEKFTFGTEGESDVYGDITISDEYGDFNATLNYSSEEALLSVEGFTATLGTKPEGLSTGYDDLATAVKNAYYEIPFKVAKDGDEEGKYKLTEGSLSKDASSSDVKVYVQAAFIRSQASRTIKLNNNEVGVTIDKYYIVPVGAQMGSNESNKTTAGKVYNVKKLAGGISYAKKYVGKNDGDEAFTNPYTLTGDGTVTYTSSNTAVATVDENGKVTIMSNAAGKTTITATLSAEDSDEFAYADDDKVATYTLVVAPENCIPGIFTVGDGKQVFFSKGNLWYSKSKKTWSFAPNQYDKCFNDGYTDVGENYKDGDWDGDYIDLFGWGMWMDATQLKDGNKNYASSINPLKTSMVESDYVSYVESGATITYEGSLNDLGLTVMGAAWRTLTGGNTDDAEWYYLFKSRDNASKKYGIATVHGTLGLIILPDDHSAPSEITTSFVSGKTNTTYSDEDWNLMQANGAVFLPAAGYRYNMDVVNVGSNGYYWSSSARGSDGAWDLVFNSDNVEPNHNVWRFHGYSVRLVWPLSL